MVSKAKLIFKLTRRIKLKKVLIAVVLSLAFVGSASATGVWVILGQVTLSGPLLELLPLHRQSTQLVKVGSTPKGLAGMG